MMEMMPDSPLAATYYKDIKPILDARCTSCHVEGGAGGFDLTSVEAAQAWSMAMAAAVEARTMPPWGVFAEDDCTPRFEFKDDKSLSSDQIASMLEWAASGAPAGDPADDNSVPTPAQTGLVDWDFEGSAAAPVVVDEGRDSFVCIVIDPGLEEETWLQGIEYLPGNKALVHHIVLFTDPTRQSLNLMGEDGTYGCFGSAGVPGSTAGAWAPGAGATLLPDGMASRVKAGTLFVMQMHYSPQGGSEDFTDLTSLRFKYAETPPRYETYTQLMGNFDFVAHPGLGLVSPEDDDGPAEFLIPAGATEHMEINRWTFTGNLPGSGAGGRENVPEVKLLGLTPHMHYAGVKQSVRIHRAEPGETACEPNMLIGLAGCSQAAGCTSADDLLACTYEACQTEWAAVDLPCWGCFHKAITSVQDQSGLIGALSKCENDVVEVAEFEQINEECLINSPQYSFEWQRLYEYDTPYESLPTFTPGTVLSIECTYNNSMENPLIRKALGRLGEAETAAVQLGDETLDEMCLTALVFAFERTD